jgi:NADH-quinone oxidoreductase subunit J
MNELIFLGAAGLALLASVMVFALRNTVYAVVSLITALSAVAILFFQLGAAFVGALQIILYAGAIMVLFLFVVMLLNVHKDSMGPDRRWLQKAVGILIGFILLGQLVLLGRRLFPGSGRVGAEWGGAQDLAHSFFGRFVLAFELTSLLLLAAMIGAVLLAHHSGREEKS